MLYPEHLKQEVEKFCELSGIQIICGVVSVKDAKLVEDFLRVKTKTDRLRTKEIEYLDSFKISPQTQRLISSFVESPIEEFMYKGFINAGIEKHCRPQFEIGTKRVDFAFPIAKLVVECDGKQYHHQDGEQIEKDQKRDIYLAKKGWMIKHYDGQMIRRNIRACTDEIVALLNPFLGFVK